MFTPGLDPIWFTKQRHQELLSEAQQWRLVREALEVGKPKHRNSSKILAFIGNKLATFGASLEERYSVQPHSESSLNQRSMAS